MPARRSQGDGSVFFDHQGSTCTEERKAAGKRQHTRCSGVWVGSISLGLDPVTRKRSRRKVSGATKTECKNKLDELRDTQRKTGTVTRGDLTVEHVVLSLLAHPPAGWKSPVTVDTNRAHGDRIIKAIGKSKMATLKPTAVEDMLRKMVADGYSASTTGRTRSILALAIRRAQRDGLVGRNAAELADAAGGSRRESRSMTMDEISKLLASQLTVFWRAWITAALQLGLRPGELGALRWEHVSFDDGVVRVRNSMRRSGSGDLKTTESWRTLELPAAATDALRALRKLQNKHRLAAGESYADRGLVFANEVGRPLCRDSIRTGLASCCKKAGVPAYTPREMRHSFVSVLSDSGVDIEVISDAVGHVNSTITRTTYRHQIADKIEATASTWNAIGSRLGLPAAGE